MDLSNDPRFTKLPQRFIDELAQYKPTGINGDTWHEVQFRMDDGIFVQVAVVNGQYVALDEDQVESLIDIIKVWSEEELK